MINIRVTESSQKELFMEVKNKIDGVKELTTTETKRLLLDTAFSISAVKFVQKTNMLARSNKDAFHHVYEWGGTGEESNRLFRIIKKSVSGGNASVYYKFNNSRKNAPIADVLTVPGKTGKTVRRSGIFKRKAEVMEKGSPVSFVTSRTIAIPSGGSISFIPPGKTINIKNPGGSGTNGSFRKHFLSWWPTYFPNSLDSKGVPKALEEAVARSLSRRMASRSSVRSAIRSTLGRYKTIGSVI